MKSDMYDTASRCARLEREKLELEEQCAQLEADNIRIYNNLAEYRNHFKKETAEKFAKELRNFIYLSDDLNLDVDTYEKISNKIDELTKQFGVEIKE